MDREKGPQLQQADERMNQSMHNQNVRGKNSPIFHHDQAPSRKQILTSERTLYDPWHIHTPVSEDWERLQSCLVPKEEA